MLNWIGGMEILEIQSYIETIEQSAELYQEKNFNKRLDVTDFLEFHVMDRLEELVLKADQPNEVQLLKYRAEKVRSRLEQIDANLFQELRVKIRTAGYTGTAFKNMVQEYVGFNLNDYQHQGEPDYDNLDVFINGLLAFQYIPQQTKELEPEMVYYQKTPARIVFELAEKAHFTKYDVFFDLGSGLGQVAILINLLAGIPVQGVEFEPAFCNYAQACAAELNLSGITFINTDARKANYNEGTVFFMFTPFKGKILQVVLEKLRKESLLRKIKIITYGPCTTQVATQNWLHLASTIVDNSYQLAVFTSV